MKIFITGATGLIGKNLVPKLCDEGHTVVVISRSQARVEGVFRKYLEQGKVSFVQGKPQVEGEWQSKVKECEAVINLVGEPVFGKRWTKMQKREILQSRVDSTKNVVKSIQKGVCKTFISASAIGYYGFSDEKEFTEDSAPGDDFLAKVSQAWEAEAFKAEECGCRVICLRLGILLDAQEGALARMLPPFKALLGGPLGSGSQWMSWLHRDDAVQILDFCLKNEHISGPVNACSPYPVSNKTFSRTLGKTLNIPTFLRLPEAALKLALGKAAEIITKGQNVKPTVLQKHAYQFKFEKLEDALADLV